MSQSLITNEAVNCAIDYILQHIHERLSVDDVAAHCHFAKYHFSRMFKEETGESVYAFIKRLKLEQSAFRMKVEPGRTVTDIGCEFGYSPYERRIGSYRHLSGQWGAFIGKYRDFVTEIVAICISGVLVWRDAVYQAKI